MSYSTTADNLYKEGAHIFAKENPTLELVIRRYHQRIYYCEVTGEPDRKDLVYFERELMAPIL